MVSSGSSAPSPFQTPLQRVDSIDAFRALTMVLMIFVNDLWSLKEIPGWLGHTAAEVDGMGLADWVFPGFLFIVGLSIPYATHARFNKGDSKWKVFRHILERSVALLVMGLFMVNLEMTNSDALLLVSKPVWSILMVLGFILVWNYYGKAGATGKWWGLPVWLLQFLGVLILVFLAVTYRSGSGENLQWMQVHWWGILGLIGWAYFLCATIYLLVGNSLLWISMATVALLGMNSLEMLPVAFKPTFVVGAANHVSVMLGVWSSILLLHFKNKTEKSEYWQLWLIIAVVALFVFGFATRPIWEISKIRGTPSWAAICAALSMLGFLVLYWVCDRKKVTAWMVAIAPAGRSTLTCYLMPYWLYVFAAPVLFNLPETWLTGGFGIVKSLVFALLVVQFTRLMEMLKVRVRI